MKKHRLSSSGRMALSLAAMGLGVLAGCANPSVASHERLAVGKSAVERATTSSISEAPAEVAAAKAKLDRANVAYANKDYELARQLAEQAEADALLAEAQARSVRADKALSEVRSGIQQLREEINRK